MALVVHGDDCPGGNYFSGGQGGSDEEGEASRKQVSKRDKKRKKARRKSSDDAQRKSSDDEDDTDSEEETRRSKHRRTDAQWRPEAIAEGYNIMNSAIKPVKKTKSSRKDDDEIGNEDVNMQLRIMAARLEAATNECDCYRVRLGVVATQLNGVTHERNIYRKLVVSALGGQTIEPPKAARQKTRSATPDPAKPVQDKPANNK